jgi:RND family efflux transporter MFP subunit
MTQKERVPVYFWVGLAAIGAAAALWFFWPAAWTIKAESRPGAEGSAPARNRVRVATVTPSYHKVRRVSTSSPAQVFPYEQTDIYAKIPGYVKKVHVDIGDVVYPPAKGDTDLAKMVREKKVLGELWVPEMEAELEQKEALVAQARANVGSAVAKVKQMEAGLRRAKAEVKRWTVEDKIARANVRRGVLDKQSQEVTEAQLEAAKAAENEVTAQVAKARADHTATEKMLRVARANRDYVATMLHYARIVAPFKGVVSKLHLYRGAFLHPGRGQRPLFTITRTDRLRVVVDIPEKDAAYLNLNASMPNNLVLVKFDALPKLPARNKPFVWRIKRFAPVLGAGKKVRAEIDVRDTDPRLFPGMYGHATVVLEERRALTLPASCLGVNDDTFFVYTVVGGKARRQVLTIGIHDGKKVEIIAGLSAADQVISQGKDSLRDGQEVVVPKTKR